MPVLPLVASRIVIPGLRSPDASAASIMLRAMRSLTEPEGLVFSTLAQISTSGLGLTRWIGTNWVPPMVSSTPLAAGTVTSTAVAPALTDPDPSNNEATQATTVEPEADPLTLLSIDGSSDRLRIVDPGSGAILSSRSITLSGEIIEGGNGLATHPATGDCGPCCGSPASSGASW